MPVDPKEVQKDLNALKKGFRVRKSIKRENPNSKPQFKLTPPKIVTPRSPDKVFFNPIESQNSILNPLANLDEFMTDKESEKFQQLSIT